MNKNICCITGHRRIPAEEYQTVLSCIVSAVDVMRKMGVNTFCIGGELGFDTEAALCVLLYKKLDPSIKIIMVIPCKTHAQDRTPLQIQNFENIKDMCDEVLCISEEYTPDCIVARNRKMIDMSSHCLCYLRPNENDGIADTVAYAEKQGLDIFNIHEYVEAER